MGKPSQYGLAEIIKDHFEGQDIEEVKKKTVMVGDNILTDMLMAKNDGIDSILVLTGVTSITDACAKKRIEIIKPTYILDSVCDILSN